VLKSIITGIDDGNTMDIKYRTYLP